MNCPECESRNWKVKDSRHTKKDCIYRRRVCNDCGCKFTTRELIEMVTPYRSRAILLN